MKGSAAIFLFYLALMGLAGCTALWWKKSSPYTKEEIRALEDRDLYFIDGRRYLKVRDREGRIRWVEARRYLSHPERWTPVREEGLPEEVPSGTWEVKREPPSRKRTPVRFPTAPPFLKRKVAVLPFGEEASRSPYGDLAAEVLERLLVSKGLVTLPVDPGLSRLPAELNPPFIKGLGEELGVQAVIGGELYGPYPSLEGEGFVVVKLRVYETVKGQVLEELTLQASAKGGGEAILEEALKKGVDRIERLMREMGWFSRIAAVDGGTFFLFAGRDSGLKEGDVLEVYTPSGELKKGSVKVVELFGPDRARARGIEGEGFAPADLVFYSEREGLASGRALRP